VFIGKADRDKLRNQCGHSFAFKTYPKDIPNIFVICSDLSDKDYVADIEDIH